MRYENENSVQKVLQEKVLERSMSLDLLDLDISRGRNVSQITPDKSTGAGGGGGKTSSFVKTVKWMPNEHSKVCLRCHGKFTLFNWRHHCRSCGE